MSGGRVRWMAGAALLWGAVAVGAPGEAAPDLPPLHHRVGMVPPEAMKPDPAVRLEEDGAVGCVSCHGIEGIDRLRPEEVDKGDARFLVGGPYRRLSDFCSRCHDEEGTQRDNLHRMLTAEGEVIEAKCLFCHREVPDREAEPGGEVELRLSREKLCYGCHLKSPHLNAWSHQVEPSEGVRERLRRHRREGGVALPLDERGLVTCVTCHRPHPRGVLGAPPRGEEDLQRGVRYVDHPWGVVYREDKRERLAELREVGGGEEALAYRRIDHEVLLRLPAADGTLCRACHAFED